ncbi:MAG: YigZ family protein [bacterium]|nr:YigZ family protein [bacterium]
MSEYRTVAAHGCAEYVEKKSRFICNVMPVKTEQEAVEYINSLKRKYWDARHNVYAYVIRQGNIQRYSDDCEPRSTAGIPTLDAILKAGLCDCVAVTTRYFGGTLLGTGGLVHAYSTAASQAIQAAGTVTMKLSDYCRLECCYNDYGKLSTLLVKHNANVLDTQFGSSIKLDFSVCQDGIGQFKKELDDLFCGSINFDTIGSGYEKIKK